MGREQAMGGSSRRRTEKASKPSKPSGPSPGDRAGPSREPTSQRQPGLAGTKTAKKIQRDFAAEERAREKKVVKKETKKAEDKQGILSAIGHGPVQEGYIGDEAFKETMPTGQHKLRSQFERLASKYGKDFYDPEHPERMSEQAKVLTNYLSNVPVERGGGLGAKDPKYGGGDFAMDPESDEFKDAEAYRQQLLSRLESSLAAGGRPSYEGINDDLARQGLTDAQYFNFRQQLMAADPTPGNMAYKEAFPFSSGNILGGIAGLAPGIGTFGKIARSALGGANEMLGGTPGEALGAGKQMFTDLRTKAGDVTGRPFAGLGKGISDWFKFNPPAEAYGNIGRPFAGAPSVRPDIDRGGVIDAAQSVVNQAEHPWGAWIGLDPNQPRTADWVDSDGDGVDDRYQTGPGTPRQGVPGGDLKMPGFEVGEITQPATIVPQQGPFASAYQPFNFPIGGGGQDPNLQNWYKNLGIMQNVYS